jgi:hypothetical protein
LSWPVVCLLYYGFFSFGFGDKVWGTKGSADYTD